LLIQASLFAFLAISPVQGQGIRSVGIHLSRLQSRPLVEGPFSTATASGLGLGIGVDVPTPIPHFSAGGRLAYNQRGGVFRDREAQPDHEAGGTVRSHYLSATVGGRLTLGWGPGSIFLLAGATLDQLLDTQCGEEICGLLQEERPSVMAVTAGLGAALSVGARFRGELEVGLTEGLGEVFRFRETGVRYRTLEVLIRGCVPF